MCLEAFLQVSLYKGLMLFYAAYLSLIIYDLDNESGVWERILGSALLKQGEGVLCST